MTIHTVEPTADTVHGLFSREFPPVVTIDPGDTVIFRTLDGRWYLEPPPPLGSGRKLSPRFEGLDNGHALCGPVAIRGAQPGMTLEVQIGAIQPGTWGWQAIGRPAEACEALGVAERLFSVWTIDAAANTARHPNGWTVQLRPFMGVMGLPPNAPGRFSTIPPRWCGGNIDCKELVSGSTLFLPIAVPGALFSVGDGHAVQSDGEVCGTAIECPMERLELTFHLHETPRLTTPRAITPAGWLTLGFHSQLETAGEIALNAMLDWMVAQYGFPREEAYMLASLVVDMRVTQIVNGAQGVHALLPPDALRR